MDSQYFAYDTLGRLTCVAKNPLGTTCDTADTATVARYEYDGFNNRSSSFYREPSGATHTHVFNYGGAGDRTRLRSWRRSNWGGTETMNIGYAAVPSPGYAPGHRASESRAATGSDPAMARNWAYYNSGRAALVAMTDARGTGYHYFGYDHLGRQKLTYQFLPDGSARYEVLFYDVFGRMIGSLATNYTTSGTTYEAEPIYWVDNEPVVRLGLTSTGGGWSYNGGEYFYNDHTGTPRATVEFGSNAVRYRASTEPFLAGAPRQDNGLRPMQMRFPGQWEERGTGFVTTGGSALSAPMSALVANHARVYDPGMGAYGQREPMVATGAPQQPWFGYAQHNPVAYVDSNGEWATFALGILAAGAALAYSSDAQSPNAPISAGQQAGVAMMTAAVAVAVVAPAALGASVPSMPAVANAFWKFSKLSVLAITGSRSSQCSNVVRAAEAEAPEISTAPMRANDLIRTLNAMYARSGQSPNASGILTNFFRANEGQTSVIVTSGITRDLLLVYRQLAIEGLSGGVSTGANAQFQQARIELINRALHLIR